MAQELAKHRGYNLTHVKQKLLTRPRRALWTFLEPTRKPKVIYADSVLGIWQSLPEDLSWNHCTSICHTGPQTQGHRAERRSAQSRTSCWTFAVTWCNQVRMTSSWAVIQWSVTAICETITDLLVWCRTWPPIWIQSVSVQDKNFSGNIKELAKVLGAE